MVDEGAGGGARLGAVAGAELGAQRLCDLFGDEQVVDRLLLHRLLF